MKKDRNCGGTMYPAYNPNMPIMGMPQMIIPQSYPPMNQPYPATQSYQNYNSVEQQLNNMQQQINSLENRVSKLETKSTTYNNKYNDSNYYML